MAEINALTLIIIGLCSGIGNAAGQWFFQDYLKGHAKKVVDTAKSVKNIKITEDNERISINIPTRTEK